MGTGEPGNGAIKREPSGLCVGCQLHTRVLGLERDRGAAIAEDRDLRLWMQSQFSGLGGEIARLAKEVHGLATLVRERLP